MLYDSSICTSENARIKMKSNISKAYKVLQWETMREDNIID